MQAAPFDVLDFAPSLACSRECTTDADCDDGNPCTIDRCSSNGFQCEYLIIDPCCPADGPCYDGDPCTEDWSCGGPGGICDYPPVNDGALCDDGLACTSNDACLAGVCEGTLECLDAIDCDDGTPCTLNVCLDGCCAPSECSVIGDVTGDGLIGELDFSGWPACHDGPGIRSASQCNVFRHDGDNDIDLRDFARFQRRYESCFDNSYTDGDGVADRCDRCESTPSSETMSADGCGDSQLSTCGNAMVEAGEGCDDGNTLSGDGCSSSCQIEGPANDSCSAALVAVDGSQNFSTIGATTDGPDEPTMCDFFGRTQVEADIWYTYTATCAGEVVVSLCGSNFDTKIAIYDGVGCPSNAAMVCSDDDCGTAKGKIESRVAFQAAQGDQYMIRIGGFNSAQGEGGRLTVTCAPPACGTTANACFVAATNNSTGCNDAVCCETVCGVDRYCCDVEWDSFCASEAVGLCSETGWPTCQVGIGSCQVPRANGGCGTVDCCNIVCDNDPFCCINEWDSNCVNGANSTCFLTCGARSGDCFAAHEDAGCNAVSCCELVCPDDPFCCETAWDADCATKANELCR
jgi:cysteine-rich repeat protein